MPQIMKFKLSFEGSYAIDPKDYDGPTEPEWITEDSEVILSDPLAFLENLQDECDATLDLEVGDAEEEGNEA